MVIETFDWDVLRLDLVLVLNFIVLNLSLNSVNLLATLRLKKKSHLTHDSNFVMFS